MKNKVLEKIQNGGQVIGTFAELGGSIAAEVIALSGFDFVIVDGEHGPFNPMEVRDYISAIDRAGATPFVRVADITRTDVMKMLDVGARGLIIPYVKNMEQIHQMVSYAKFTPVGDRGFCPNTFSGWGTCAFANTMEGYMKYANENTLLIPQCETKEALNIIEEIVAVDGIDGIFIGPADLSISMGIPGQYDNPDFKAAINRIFSACKKAGKICIVFVPDIASARQRLQQGFDGISYNLDIAILMNACKEALSKIKS